MSYLETIDILKGMEVVAGIGGAYFFSLVLLSLKHDRKFGEPIDDFESLEKVVDEESKKLGLDSEDIEFVESVYNCWVASAGNSKRFALHYDLASPCSTRQTVKHELYHMLKDEGRNSNFFSRWFLTEPRAYLYGSFGIKL